MKGFRFFIFAGILSLFSLQILGCSSREEKMYKEAQDELEQNHFHIAEALLEKITLREPRSEVGLKATRDAARVAFFEIKDFKKSEQFYQLLVLSSPDANERLFAQKQIASVFMDHLQDYPKAVSELNKLISMLTDLAERAKYKMLLARAYYYQNNFAQAQNEAEEFLRGNISDNDRFDMMMLKGNIHLAEKNLQKAADVFRELMQKFPQRAKQDNVGLTLAVCYEEMKDYKNAIATLEILKQTHPMPEYIDVRIKRLSEMARNQPGARGFRK